MSDHKIKTPKKPAATDTPARRGPLAVTEALARRVIGGEWDDESTLPTEVELAEQLGVARTSVREALTRLKAKGLLASRQKAGTRVLPRMQWNMLDEDVLRWTWSGHDRAQMAQHLMQLRRIVEPAACEIAAASAPDAAIAAIERAYRLMDAAGMDPVAYAGPDLSFHQAILSATGNPFLVAFGATIEAALRMSFELSTRQPGAPRKSLPMHRAVLDQIWARKPAAARKAMEELLGLTESNIQRGVARSGATPPA
ncbi:DNA-binding FadR family transcriptional regulator [Variovorax paradoxus]|uniref:DNA-binding FadR family transcriptional regulator n=1 Tax=Variovorax paradoxus TaxID=34073 RepID=A0AAW8EG39_VARPD|nr:FCD domain-containing protein [Variovorax paradoxus]MDP9971900.1 DNA-binding FadR family transcriptional regulator [Variovorax paradoxus]